MEVSLRLYPKQVELRVTDNGTGLMRASTAGGMGLANMEARAAEAGGYVSIQAADRSGKLDVGHHHRRPHWVNQRESRCRSSALLQTSSGLATAVFHRW